MLLASVAWSGLTFSAADNPRKQTLGGYYYGDESKNKRSFKQSRYYSVTSVKLCPDVSS